MEVCEVVPHKALPAVGVEHPHGLWWCLCVLCKSICLLLERILSGNVGARIFIESLAFHALGIFLPARAVKVASCKFERYGGGAAPFIRDMYLSGLSIRAKVLGAVSVAADFGGGGGAIFLPDVGKGKDSEKNSCNAKCRVILILLDLGGHGRSSRYCQQAALDLRFD